MKEIDYRILNSTTEIKTALFQSVCENLNLNADNFEVEFTSKLICQQFYILCRMLGKNVNTVLVPDDLNKIKLKVTTSFSTTNPLQIIQIIDLGIIEDYVYDLETENHHF